LEKAFGAVAQSSNWRKIRDKNLESKLTDDRTKNGEPEKKDGIFINVENTGFPSSKELGRIEKKDILNA
jgi:hypothetical protein